MDSLNVPVPGQVSRLVGEIRGELAAFDEVSARHSLVCKRFESRPEETRLRDALAGTPAFEARVDTIGRFDDPPTGPAPVVYLAVESPGLRRLHDRLVDIFGAVPELEGSAYVPHVTLARGGAAATAERLTGRSVGPVTWTVSGLERWSAARREAVGRIDLPREP